MLLCLTADLETFREWLLPLIWLWPLLLWSEMGVREGKYGVDQLLFSAPAPLWRQLPAAWTAVGRDVVGGMHGRTDDFCVQRDQDSR